MITVIFELCYKGFAEQDHIRDIILQASGLIKRNSLDRIEVENKQIPILIFEEARGIGWGRMLTIERDRASNYSNVYELIFSPALEAFEKMFYLKERKQNIMKMTIHQGALMSLQHMEGDNKEDPHAITICKKSKTTQRKK